MALESIESSTGRLLAGELLEREPPVAGAAAVEPGVVLFGKLRPYLAKTWLVDRPAYVSTELLALRPRDGIDSRWLAYVCGSRPLIDWSIATSDGTKMPRTSWEKLSEFRVNVPTPRAQRQIANFLDAETARIGALIEKKKRMSHLVTERLSLLIESELRAMASRNGEVPLRHLADVTVGIVVTPAAYYADEGVPALRGVNVAPGLLKLDDLVRISPEGHALHPKSQLRTGDLVTVRTGQAGATAVVPEQFDGANCIDLLVTRPHRELSSHFLELVINSDWCRKHIKKYSVGSIQGHFNVEALKDLPIPRADLTAQAEFVGRIHGEQARTERLAHALDVQITLLREHRRALITAAVTGELDVATAAR